MDLVSGANNCILDIHTHILPGIDDGARDVENALEMIRLSYEQGVTHMVATPHFYGWEKRIEDFLSDREDAYQKLLDNGDFFKENPMEILLGSEVAYFEGISEASGIEQLTIGSTNVMLLEMPFKPWNDYIMDEVFDLSKDYHLVLAHIERFKHYRGNEAFIKEMADWSLSFQCNAEVLLDWKTRGYALRLFKEGKARLLGSDTHSLHRRPPNLGEGRAFLAKKLGPSILEKMDQYGADLLNLHSLDD